MKKIILSIALTLFVFTSATFSENSNNNKGNKGNNETTVCLQGKVLDKMSGEKLAGVNIKVEGTDFETYTDLDGNFEIGSLKPGKYNISIDYISYKACVKSYDIEQENNKFVIELEEK